MESVDISIRNEENRREKQELGDWWCHNLTELGTLLQTVPQRKCSIGFYYAYIHNYKSDLTRDIILLNNIFSAHIRSSYKFSW